MHRRTFLKTTAVTATLSPFIASTSFSQSSEIEKSVVEKIRSTIAPITDKEREQRIENACQFDG
jgi:hypothetical protein